MQSIRRFIYLHGKKSLNDSRGDKTKRTSQERIFRHYKKRYSICCDKCDKVGYTMTMQTLQKPLMTMTARRKRGRPTKYHPEILVFLEAYLTGCVDTFDIPTRRWHVRLPTIVGFALYLGVHRDTLYSWARTRPECEEALERLMTEQFLRLIEGGLSGRYKEWLVIRMLKNNHREHFLYS